MPIHIINRWEVSIRPCEFDNFSRIFDLSSTKHKGNSKEYQSLMTFLTDARFSLVDLIDLEDNHYNQIINKITRETKTANFLTILHKCREMVKNKSNGSNIIRYLLYILNNKILKLQYEFKKYDYWPDLHLNCKCIPFDKMPFNTSLVNHNPRLSDLFDCIDSTDREYELLARVIKNNTETKGELYTSIKEIKGFKDIRELVKIHNNKLYETHIEYRSLKIYKDFIYVAGNESDTIQIIKKIKELSLEGIKGHTNKVDSWLQSVSHGMDCEDKKASLRLMFENSKVTLIYGSAGTGKSTMINHISQFFNDYKKLYLANTNPAIDNLRRKVTTANCEFKTVAKFLKEKKAETNFDLLFVDECSTVSNFNIIRVLNKASFKLLILVGDILQIESISFGNWFSVLRSFIPTTSITELTIPYRTKNSKLLELWKKVRNIDDDILEYITTNNYSSTLDDSIFVRSKDDEIILLLNYDGLYGINNINKFLQGNNKNTPIVWGNLIYKIGDPILFNDTKRFGPSIYNNLKGKIINIENIGSKIQFDIEIDKPITEMDTSKDDFHLLNNLSNGNSVIRFDVAKHKSTDEDDESSDTIVPFQIAYAVSIHKAQGLEYSSVKLIITDEVEEMITHNIFYTAITRAKEKLKIYWSPETENKILTSIQIKNIKRDINLLKSKIL